MMSTLVRKGRKSAKEKSYLPDEIVTNILYKLPVKSLVRFELVCKGWRDIILAPDFVDRHFKTSIPVILVSSHKHYSITELFALDKWWEFARNRLMTIRFPFNSEDFFPNAFDIPFSHAGMIVLNSSQKIFILNPARPSNECVKITVCEGIFRTNICAVYYHPFLQAYVSLLKMEISELYTRKPQVVHYKLLNLGSNPSLKTISRSLKYRMKEIGAVPVYINGYVYWMVMSEHGYKYRGLNDILEFDIVREEFVVIPCPVPLNTECMDDQTHLLSNDGVLIFVLILPSKITIWSLEDHEEHLWSSIEYTVSLDLSHSNTSKGICIISLAYGKLAFMYDRRLCICNLKEGTVKSNPKKRYTYGTSFHSHQMSLASLKNCKSELYIDKDGELLQ